MADTNHLPANLQQKNLLFDFYGGLLTERQRSFFMKHYMEDFSLAEIGEHFNVTPQAVADLLKRANKLLEGYEAHLGLVEKLTQQIETMRRIHTQTDILIKFADENKIIEISDAAAQVNALTAELML